ncbi:MAG TPA: ferritin-like domain-containing protein, partial [Acidimicrobiales bacterium]|nr:ferritin-like domain-containing protein [Acidimicrobiales bacterium]
MSQIQDRAQLVRALHDAAEIEQQLMCSYLYAAFSMKKDPDDGCTPAQLEYVRRWASVLYMVARQEMEHLSLVNGMLTAIGEPPFFSRQNIGPAGLLSPYFSAPVLAAAGHAGPEPVSLP